MKGKRTAWIDKFRIDPSLRDALRDAAEANFRSMNQEILYRLTETFQWDRVVLRGETKLKLVRSKGRRQA